MGGRRNSISFEARRRADSEIDEQFLQSIFESDAKSFNKVPKNRPTTSKGHAAANFSNKQSVDPPPITLDLTLPTLPKASYFQTNSQVNKPSRATSAKVFSAHNYYNNQSDIKQREQRKLLQLQQQLHRGPQNNPSKKIPLRTDSASDEDFIRNCLSAMSSASSSISWAEDAVEAEFTEKLKSLWDDIDKVCSGKIIEKPERMSQSVYEECCQWERAFPFQNLERFSKTKDSDATPTPSSARSRFEIPEAITPLSTLTPNFSPPDSRLQDCLTPNPLTSSDYVNSWLSECQKQSLSTPVEDLVEDKDELKLPPFLTFPHDKTEATEEKSSVLYSTKTSLPVPKLRPSSSTTDTFQPDPNKFFTSLVLSDSINGPSFSESSNNNRNIPANEESERRSMGNGQYLGNVRVQRPISSHIRGHTITPIATGLVPQNSIRKSSANRVNSTLTVSSNNGGSLPLLNLQNNFVRPHEEKSFAYNQHSSASYTRSRGGGGNNSASLSSKCNPSWSRHSGGAHDAGGDNEGSYFETIAEDFTVEVEPTIAIRPDYLPVSSNSTSSKSSANVNNGPLRVQSNNREKQPAKPFFFWLLDRVSPN